MTAFQTWKLEHMLFVGCDYLRVRPGLIMAMIRNLGGRPRAEALVPKVGGKAQPLLANTGGLSSRHCHTMWRTIKKQYWISFRGLARDSGLVKPWPGKQIPPSSRFRISTQTETFEDSACNLYVPQKVPGKGGNEHNQAVS